MPNKQKPKREIDTKLSQLRAGRADYGVGVTAKRSGLGFQIYGGDHSQLLCAVNRADVADFIARAVAAYRINFETKVAEKLPPWKCPKCGSDSVECLDTRPRDNCTWRRRRCKSCNVRWSTSEQIAVEPLPNAIAGVSSDPSESSGTLKVPPQPL